MNYPELLEDLKKNSISPKMGDYYEYDDFPNANLFHLFWDFGQKFLESNEMKRYFSQPRMYFNTNTSINALAYTEGKYSNIEIYKGLIIALYSFFEGKKSAFTSKSLSSYKAVASKWGIAPDFFLFQILTQFVCYHEIGHLIQRNPAAHNYSEYLAGDCNNNTENRHVKEFDADWFAANRLAFQIVDLNMNLNESFDNEEKIELLHKSAELALAALYIYLIKTSESFPDIYHEFQCHPHPSVRLTYIVFYFIDTIRVKVSAKLNQERILKNAIMISTELMNDQNPNPIEKYSLKMFESLDKIDTYVKKIISDCDKYPECCRNKLPIK